MKRTLNGLAILAAMTLSACAGVPTKDSFGYVYARTVSACRANGMPNDKCVGDDLKRCVAMVDYANPGRSESAYMGLITGIATLVGTAITYTTAGVGATAGEAVSGTIIGSSAGTALGYNLVLYRSAVEACMYSYGRDPKLTEQYFGLVKYSSKVEEYKETAEKLTPK